MFTGIVTHLGKVKKISNSSLEIKASKEIISNLEPGSSISVNGICLTVTELGDDNFAVDFIPETAQKTNINTYSENDTVNLELSATPITFLSGHVVQGHIDAVGKIRKITDQGNSRVFEIEHPKGLNKYIVEKGSIAVNGIALTVIESNENYFTVGIIPHTLTKTMLKNAKAGDMLNLEVDILAKYLEKLSRHKP